jgi:hypothetical protein
MLGSFQAGCGEAAKNDPRPHSRRTEPVEILESGFSTRRLGDGRHVLSWGAVLANRAGTAMGNIAVRVDALDETGATLKSDTIDVSVIPSGDSFNLGGELELLSAAANLKVMTESGNPLQADYSLPQVSSGKLRENGNGKRTIVTRVTNTLVVSLSDYAGVYAVLRDANGQIVGGAGTLLPAELPPGRSTRVEFLDTEAIPATATSVAISADNRTPSE